jgi:hypothetical protein
MVRGYPYGGPAQLGPASALAAIAAASFAAGGFLMLREESAA